MQSHPKEGFFTFVRVLRKIKDSSCTGEHASYRRRARTLNKKMEAYHCHRLSQSRSHSHAPIVFMLAPGLSRPNARHNYALPLPSLNHRHRGIPIHLPPLRTLRLMNKPGIFAQAETVLTRSMAEPIVGERVAKAMGCNLGRGPVWELLEDRSWFREYSSGDQTRHIVYHTVQVKSEWKILSPEYVFFSPNLRPLHDD